jgi:hypothetical protein
LGISSIEGEVMVFDCLSDKRPESSKYNKESNSAERVPKKVKDVAKRIEADGRPMPRLFVTVRMK